MGVIVVVYAAFGLTVSEAKTEIMSLRARGMSESIGLTSLYTSGETSTTMLTCPSRSTGAYATHGAASGTTPSNCTTDRALPSSSKSGC